MRRPALVAASLLALAFVAAASARNPRAEQERLNPADMRIARAAVLHSRDFKAGWKATSSSPDSDTGCPAFRPDFSKFVITGKAHVELRHTSGAIITSELNVFAYRAHAAGDFRLSATTNSRCKAWETRTETKGGRTTKVVVAKIVPMSGIGERAAHYQLVSQVTEAKRVSMVYVDGIAFQQGRSVGWVVVAARQPARSLDVLARLMLARSGA